MCTNMLHIRHQIPGGILAQFCMRRRATAAALIKKDDAVFLWIMQATHGGRDAAARPTVDHDNRFAIRIAALLDMDAV
ncbi:hypothetical protein D9M72_570540 [compost metagenome]